MQTIILDLHRQSILSPLKAKQNDRYSRFFKAVLLECSTAFSIPLGAVLTVRYIAPGGCGWYDTITEIDGKKTHTAFEVRGNEVTVELAEAMLTLPGSGTLCLQIYTQTGYRIGTWNIPIEIEKDPCSDQNIVASDYYNVLTAQVAQTLQYKKDAATSASAAAASEVQAANSATQAADSAKGAEAVLSSAVKSVNGKTPNKQGAVTLTAEDVGAGLPDESVTTAKIANGAITTPKFSADAKVPNAGHADTAGSANTAGTATKANGIGELTASIDKAQGHWWLNYGGAGNVDGTMPVYYAKKAGTARANNISMGYDGNLHISFS